MEFSCPPGGAQTQEEAVDEGWALFICEKRDDYGIVKRANEVGADCFAFLAMFRGTSMRGRPWMKSLSRSAYVMYLVHYVFVTWSQRLLPGAPVSALVKFLMVFAVSTLVSWMVAQLLLRVPAAASVL